MAVVKSTGPRIQLVAGVLLTVIPLWLAAWYFRVRNPLFISHHPIPAHNAWNLNRETFIQEWLENQIGNSPNQSAVFHLCRQPTIKWRPNVVLDLDDANGGIGNVRGNIFDFLCLAILTGSSIVLPSFQSRSPSDLSALWNGKIPFNTFFDEDHFISTFASACPKMNIYRPSSNISLPVHLVNRYGMPSMRQDLHPSPEETEAENPNTPQAVVTNFNAWLVAQNPGPAQNLTLVSVGRTLWEGLDTHSLPLAVRRDFGGSLRLLPKVRRLAAIVTFNLARQHYIHTIDPRLSFYPQAFLGAHLRTESDAVNAGWLTSDTDSAHANFTGQTDAYLSQAVEKGLKLIYTASGNASEIQHFAQKAFQQHNITVTSKTALLSGPDLAALEQMSWDQQALVDYEVLRRSSSLAAFVKSSFGFGIAITRREFVDEAGVVGVGEGLWLRPEDRDESVAYEDGLSKVWGRFLWQEERMVRGAWP